MMSDVPYFQRARALPHASTRNMQQKQLGRYVGEAEGGLVVIDSGTGGT